MRQNDLKGQRKYRTVHTTDSRHEYPVAENVLQREFTAEKPNQKWVVDITYITHPGRLAVPVRRAGLVFAQSGWLGNVKPDRYRPG